jgi:hypothetical protein
MPLHELPSLTFPLYHWLGGMLVIAAAVYAAISAQPLWLLLAAALLVLPSLLLALKTCWQLRQIAPLLPLAALYFTYGWSRAAALFKR